MSFVFASHSHVDRTRIQPILDELLRRHLSIWIDDPVGLGLRAVPDPALRIRSGAPWDAQIDDALQAAGCVLAFLSAELDADTLDSRARFVWLQEIAYAKTVRKLVMCRLDSLDIAKLPFPLAAQQIINLSSHQSKESWNNNLDLLIADIQQTLKKTATAGTRIQLADASDSALTAEEQRWLQSIYEREVGAMLEEGVRIFDRDGHVDVVTKAFSDPSFQNLYRGDGAGDFLRKAPSFNHNLRTSLARYEKAKARLLDEPTIRLVVSPAHAASLAILTFLREDQRLPLEFDFTYAHSVEILEQALSGDLAYDGFTLTIATAGAFLREQGESFQPFCAMPSMTHGVLSSNTTRSRSIEGEYLLLKDIPSSELLIAQSLAVAAGPGKVHVTQAEPDEATRALGSGSPTARAIIGFPHYEFNLKYGNCLLLPGPNGNFKPSRNVFLFMNERFAGDLQLAEAWYVAIRHAWLSLLESAPLQARAIAKLLNTPNYVETLYRITGVRTLSAHRATPETPPEHSDSPTVAHDTRSPAAFFVSRCAASQIIELRQRVLREHGPRDEVLFLDDDAPESLHYCARDAENHIIGCVSLLPSSWRGGDAWQLRGMAVDKAHQHRGVGRQLMASVDSDLTNASQRRAYMWCNARMTAVGFYARLGWQVCSPVHPDGAAGPSVVMARPCP